MRSSRIDQAFPNDCGRLPAMRRFAALMTLAAVLVTSMNAADARVGASAGAGTATEESANVSRQATRGPSIQLTQPPPPPSGGVAGGGRVVHLTFDDGPSAYTPAVLDLLRRYDARATFFVIGSQVRPRAGLVARAAAEGHAIANHTWSHPRLGGIGSGAFWQQIGWTQTVVAEVAGRVPTCLRPPYGSTDRNTVPWAAQFGLRVVMWDVDPQDWRTPGASAIASRVVNNVRPGSVVLLHDGGGSRQQTVNALGSILVQLSARGYRFEPVPGC